MTTGRINQVDIFPKQKDRDAQRTTSEPPQHTRTAAFPFAHNKTASKSKNNQRARAVTAIVCIESHSRLSLRERQKHDRKPHSSDRNQATHTSTAHTESRATTRTRVSPNAPATLCNSISFYKTELVSPELQCHNFPHTHTAHTHALRNKSQTHAAHTRAQKQVHNRDPTEC